MPGPLGCVNEYQVVLHQKGGAGTVARLSPLVSVDWNRRLNEIADATVVIAKRAATADCCAALAQTSPFAFEVTIYRGQSLVWQGPVARTVESRDTFTITARDVVSWFDVRTVQASYMYTDNTDNALKYPTGPAAAAVVIAEQYIRDAFTPGRKDPNNPAVTMAGLDVNLMPWIEFHRYADNSAGPDIEHSAYYPVDLVGERFNDLADDGLDYTTVGRRIVVGPPDWMFRTGAVARLTENDFAEDVELAVEGDGLATRYIAYPAAFERDWMHTPDDPLTDPPSPYQDWGTANAPGTDATGTHPYYGRVERVAELDTASRHTSTFVNRAKQYIKRHFPAPVVLRVPDQAALHPDARVGVADLVCGSRVDVVLGADVWCQPTAGAFFLSGVAGHWDKDGERILIALEASNEGLVVG